MPILIGLVVIALQGLCVWHIFSRGSERYWIYVVLFVPGAGAFAYVISEVLPEVFGSREAGQAVTGIKDVVDPGRNYRKLHEDARLVDSAEAKRMLADECARKGNFSEAIEHYRAAMAGIHAEDPGIVFSLATALLENDKFSEAIVELKRLESIDARYKPTDRQLLHARALHSQGETKLAEREYRAVMTIHPGPEAKVRFAHLLYTDGRRQEAQDLLQGVIDQSKKLPAHSRRLNRYWIDQARTALEQVKAG
jgi:hypothetical protein